MDARMIPDRESVKVGSELLIPVRSGNKTLAVRVSGSIHFDVSDAGTVYVSFMAYRIRKTVDRQERSSFGHKKFYMIRLNSVTPF
jgi:hypothetical protein